METMGRTAKDRAKYFALFALPGIFVFVCVVIIPFVYGIYLTFTDWDGVKAAKNLVGLANYLYIS